MDIRSGKFGVKSSNILQKPNKINYLQLDYLINLCQNMLLLLYFAKILLGNFVFKNNNLC